MKQVRISSAGQFFGSSVVDAETGVELHGITEATISMLPDEIVKARLTIECVDLSIGAQAVFLITHPETGARAEIAEIRFADGTSWRP